MIIQEKKIIARVIEIQKKKKKKKKKTFGLLHNFQWQLSFNLGKMSYIGLNFQGF